MSSKSQDPVSVGSAAREILAEESRQRNEAKVCEECGELFGYRVFPPKIPVCMSDQCQRRRRYEKAIADPWHYASQFGVPPGWQNKYKSARTRGELDFALCDAFFWGPTGTGKTHAMAAKSYGILIAQLANEKTPLGEEWCAGLRWVYAPTLFMELRESFREKSRSSELEIVARYVRYDILFLDDLFAEKTSGYTLSATCAILAQREQANRRTIITSNERLEEILVSDPRIATHISGYRSVAFTGKDRRKERA